MFDNPINGVLKNFSFLKIIGVFFIITGVIYNFIPRSSFVFFLLILKFLSIICYMNWILFFLQNQKILNGWGWYLMYETVILCLNIYLLLDNGESLVYFVGFMILLNASILLIISIDFRLSSSSRELRIAIWSISGCFLSFVVIFPFILDFSAPNILVPLAFITTGIASMILLEEFNKLNKHRINFRKLQRKF